uniref:Reverse transcriptase domain-containing protein n=1 Tax=Tanacetum cinerariifolium TaxID=118510 RepID=A0A699H440_TANCI|nr:reverse transcriptase domain-containing protein [Tanacetum cinerariifolium]
MRTRKSYLPNNSSATIPRRQNKRRTPNIVEPELRTIIEMADNRTMDELLQVPTEGYGEAIVIPEINADHFEIKTNLLQLIQANLYHGFERENPHTLINNFKRITSTLKFRDVPNDVIKLMMFPYSLEGNARVWYDKEPPNSILTCNTIPTPKGEMKAITTRSDVAYEGPSIHTPKKVVEREIEETKDKEQSNFQGSTTHIQPPVTPILEPDVSKTLPNPNIPYPSRLNDQKLLQKATNQMENNGLCHALADLGVSINLMPLSIWKNLSLPKLTPTRMSLELADRSITRPKGVTEDVFVKVGRFHFLTDFVVVDFEADPCVNDEAVTFNLNQTTRYSSTYNDLSVNRIDIIDVAREEYAQEFHGFNRNSSGGNTTLTFDHILSDSSFSLTPFEGNDFILEEINAYLKDESVLPEIDHADC